MKRDVMLLDELLLYHMVDHGLDPEDMEHQTKLTSEIMDRLRLMHRKGGGVSPLWTAYFDRVPNKPAVRRGIRS